MPGNTSERHSAWRNQRGGIGAGLNSTQSSPLEPSASSSSPPDVGYYGNPQQERRRSAQAITLPRQPTQNIRRSRKVRVLGTGDARTPRMFRAQAGVGRIRYPGGVSQDERIVAEKILEDL